MIDLEDTVGFSGKGILEKCDILKALWVCLGVFYSTNVSENAAT